MSCILLVDADANRLALLRQTLAGTGWTFTCAADGAQALALARLNPPDAVVSALLMPVLDGYALLHQWLADPALCSIPVVISPQAAADAACEQLARALGAHAWCADADVPAHLRRAVQSALDARTPAGAPAEPSRPTPDRRLRVRQDNEPHFQALFEHSMDIVLMTSPDGNIHLANPAACRAFGLSEAQIRQAGRSGLVDQTDPRLPALLAERSATGHVFGELTMRRGDGERFPVEITSALYRDADGGQRSSMIVRDISARKQQEAVRLELENQLRESQKLQAVGTLAGGIAHDFNNIIGAILGYTALARQDLQSGLPIDEHLAQVDTAGRRARSLVQRILSFSRPQPTDLARLPLRPLIEDTLALLRPSLPANVRLETRLADEPLAVLADGTQLQQVLLNLCMNAWHALGEAGGRIELGLSAAACGPDAATCQLAMPTGRCAHLWVSDDGCGIDDATRARIFEPFFTTKPEGQGSGLGLSAVHGIVGAHQGALAVDTEVGRGSTFHLYLPLKCVEDPASIAAPRVHGELAAESRHPHVMYVDDDETMALLVGQLLGRAGYRVTLHHDADLALAELRAHPELCDLVVTDHHMPRVSGLDLARALRKVRADLPVIISSGHIEKRLLRAAKELGVHALLSKERMVDDLLPRVRRALCEPASDS
jgi:PAS domain S-box-containing protein